MGRRVRIDHINILALMDDSEARHSFVFTDIIRVALSMGHIDRNFWKIFVTFFPILKNFAPFDPEIL